MYGLEACPLMKHSTKLLTYSPSRGPSAVAASFLFFARWSLLVTYGENYIWRCRSYTLGYCMRSVCSNNSCYIFSDCCELTTDAAFSCCDGERVDVEWCLEQRHDVLVAVRRSDVVLVEHPWPCTQGHLHRHRNCRDHWQPVCARRLLLVHQDHWQGTRHNGDT